MVYSEASFMLSLEGNALLDTDSLLLHALACKVFDYE
jgi:hypothetical protein